MTAATHPRIRLRPQPVGIFPPPASFLLLPEIEDGSALPRLMSGDAEAVWPRQWLFYKRALDGNVDEAVVALEGTRFLDRWNRFILRPDPEALSLLRAEVPAEMIGLLDAAAFATGLSEELPVADGLDGELRALVQITASSGLLERGEIAAALELLEDALASSRSTSPLLAAQILHQIGSIERASSPAKAIPRYQEALKLALGSPLKSLRAELWMNLGMCWQESAEGRRGVLLEAAKAYQEAIRCGLSLESMPEMYAMAQSNLALTYLSIPARDASDQLRMGIAVQCLREALKVFERDTHPELWSTAQLNLANALQYLPTSHPEENLQQAVEIYEELLQVRNKAFDPLGYARLLANQANALAHLGIFGPALEKLNEAHKLFHWHGEAATASSVLELVSEINLKIGNA